MKATTLISLALLSFSLVATSYAEEKRYISDELFTWVRSGPGDQYRLIKTLQAGETVTLLQSDQNTQYGQIRDSNGNTAWIPLSQLSSEPSLRTQVPRLEQQVRDLTNMINNIEGEWNQRTSGMQKKVAASDGIINGLKRENQQLKNQLIVAQKKVDAANIQLDDKQRAIILQWFIYGGCVAGIGLLIGLCLPFLFSRRKKTHRWMG